MSDAKIERRTILKLIPFLSFFGGNVMSHENNDALKITDFSFLTGEWKIKNKRRKSMPDGEWDYFDGAATITSVLNKMGSIEELRIPPNKPFGMGIRLFDKDKKMWADHWVSGQNNIINPPMYGSFINNEAIFTSDDFENEKPIKVKSVWDKITPKSCRWWQAVSYDEGKTWVENWVMEWTRA